MAVNAAISPELAVSAFLNSLKKPSRLLVAISGGSDSTGLLVALDRALRHGNVSHSLTAATVDHALRAESAAEAESVADFCARLGIPHVIRRWQDEKPATGLSAAAREARYRLLVEAAGELGADLIVTGHTADDQTETIAMRSARAATASHGLSGMAPAMLYERSFWIMRPFLGVRRADIRGYLATGGHGWIDDPTNLDPHYERVRTREALAAAGATPIEPDMGARRMRMSAEAAHLVRQYCQVHGGTVVHLDSAALDADAQVLRHALAVLLAVTGGRPHLPGSDAMARVMAFLGRKQSGRMTVARTLVQKRKDGVYLMRERRDILPLAVAPGQTTLWDGRFVIHNLGERELRIEPGSATESIGPLEAVPESMARHAARIVPHMVPQESTKPRGLDDTPPVRIEPALAPFDRFLPAFDLDIANAVARLFRREPYPSSPI